jgi:hypothetical protein
VGPPGEEDQYYRRAGAEQGVEQFRLPAGQAQVRGVAALTRGARAEHPRPVAEHGDAGVGGARHLGRLGQPGVIAAEHRAALREADLVPGRGGPAASSAATAAARAPACRSAVRRLICPRESTKHPLRCAGQRTAQETLRRRQS